MAFGGQVDETNGEEVREYEEEKTVKKSEGSRRQVEKVQSAPGMVTTQAAMKKKVASAILAQVSFLKSSVSTAAWTLSCRCFAQSLFTRQLCARLFFRVCVYADAELCHYPRRSSTGGG